MKKTKLPEKNIRNLDSRDPKMVKQKKKPPVKKDRK